MSFQWYEETGSRSATVYRLGMRARSTCAVKWRMLGASSESQVHSYCNEFFTANRLRVINGQAFLVENYEVQHLGGDAWEVTATYATHGMDDDNTVFKRGRTVETTGETAHITSAIAERRYGSGAPDMKGAIGVDGESVQGVDIVVPALTWQETYDIPNAVLTPNYFKTVSSMTGCVNDSSFRSFAAGEVLFLGFNGSQQWDSEKGDGPWNMSFKFSARQNQTNMSVGDITGIRKDGHEYLWVLYEPAVESSTVVRKAKAVYVNEVFRKVSFASLGIGVG